MSNRNDIDLSLRAVLEECDLSNIDDYNAWEEEHGWKDVYEADLENDLFGQLSNTDARDLTCITVIGYTKNDEYLRCDFVDRSVAYFKDGYLHKDDGPAIIRGNGEELYFLNGEQMKEHEYNFFNQLGDK